MTVGTYEEKKLSLKLLNEDIAYKEAYTDGMHEVREVMMNIGYLTD